jgi:tetratricopeptide (TPR) repeat protein
MSRILATFLLITGTLSAGEEWIKVTTPHFELYTTAGEKKAREAILYFEQVRSFFLQASPSKKVPEFPVRIIAFRSEKEYRPYRINDFAAAFYTRNDRRDYIVMENISAERYPVAIHEYVHLIVEHSGLKLPIWLNEGWAEVQSTLKPLGNKAQIGDIIPGRAQELMTGKWIDLVTLTSADRSSPFYNEKAKAGMFYSESWALAHMLSLSPEYRQQFTTFVASLANGKEASESFQTAFHKSIAQVQDDLRRYLTRTTLYGAVFNLKLDRSAEDPDVVAAPSLERELVLADLLAQTGKTDLARSAYERIARSNPGKPDVEESLGYLAWRTDERSSAIEHFTRAVAGGSKNAQLCFDLAMLQRQSGVAEAQVLPTLRKAVELKPDYVEARLQLGYMELSAKEYANALRTLASIKRVTPDQAAHLFSALAYTQPAW